MPDTSTEVAIATTTLGSANTTITFSSIPSTYTDLRIVFVDNGLSTADRPVLQFNGDTGANYSVTRMTGTGSAAGSTRNTSDNQIRFQNSNLESTYPSLLTVDIFSYTASVNKTCLGMQSDDGNGTGNIFVGVGLWRSTSTINQILIKTISGNNFATGTTATLYGIL